MTISVDISVLRELERSLKASVSLLNMSEDEINVACAVAGSKLEGNRFDLAKAASGEFRSQLQMASNDLLNLIDFLQRLEIDIEEYLECEF